MSSSKRPSTSSLRRFITSRPYVPVAEIRRRFGLDEPDCICMVERDGVSAYVGLPERESVKIQDLWSRGEIGLELSVEVHAPVVVGIYPMRIARYVMDGNGNGNGYHVNGHHGPSPNGHAPLNSHPGDEIQSSSFTADTRTLARSDVDGSPASSVQLPHDDPTAETSIHP